jgi:hypothetical protein
VAPTSHPKARRSYELRSGVTCVLCGRCDLRRYGRARGQTSYLVCRPDIRQQTDRAGPYDAHPKGVTVRQDRLPDIRAAIDRAVVAATTI